MSTIELDGRTIGGGARPFIIAEACINHEGDVATATQMVYSAHAMGADCIKFQLHVLENEMLRETPQSDNFEDPLWDTLARTELTVEEHIRLRDLCRELGMLYLCTPFSRDASDILEKELDVAAFKIGSGELTNLPLIEHVAKKGRPVIISTGMSLLEEIDETVDLLRDIGTPFAVMHCVSAYPTPYDRMNLGLIPRYAERYGVPIGLSDHSRGVYAALGAVALGASFVEKHFTLDRMAPGPDHPSSIEPYELGELAKGAAAVHAALGADRKIFPEEEQIVAWARESVVSEVAIAAGTVIEQHMVWVKRPAPPEGGVKPRDLGRVVGMRAARNIPVDTQLRWEDLE